ncbi:Major facilitator super domain-containing protein 7 [Chytriomyces hyalinus]|nr:Major facilitator super domain-containing protein 7 [Chytriomyces hyalinus]
MLPETVNLDEVITSQKGHKTRLYPLRFAVGAGVFFANINSAILWATYASVTPTTAKFYNCSEWTINQLSLYVTLAFIPFAYPSMWVLDTWGLRAATLIGTWGAVVGALIRYLSFLAPTSGRLPMLFAGQILVGIANPFTLNSPPKVCALWFGERERLTANTVMSLALYAGTAVVLAVAPAIVKGDPENVNTLNMATFVVCFVLGLTSCFVYDKPLTPPSKSAEEESLPFMEGLKDILTNWQFWLMFVVFGVVNGVFETYVTLISDYIVPYGYTETDAGTLGVITIVTGTVSSLVLGVLLDRNKHHRIYLKLLCGVMLVGVIGVYFTAFNVELKNFLFLSTSVMGAGGFPLTPIALELGVECTHPVGEGTSGTLLHLSAQISGIVILVVSNALRTENGELGRALIWLCGCSGLVCVVAPFYNALNRRMELESLANTSASTFITSTD